MNLFRKIAYLTSLSTALLGLVIAGPLSGQGLQRQQKATLEVSAPRAVAPGETLRLTATVVVEDHWHVNSHTPSFEELMATELSLDLPEGWPEATLSYPDHKLQKFPYFDDPIAVYAGTLEIPITIEVPADAAAGPLAIPLSLFYQACDDRQCLPPVTREAEVKVAIGGSGDEAAKDGSAKSAGGLGGGAQGGAQSLAAMLLAGVLGGLILNAMPCVLPVLSLKVFGLVKSAGQGRKPLITGSLATAAGILLSFFALALIAVVARGAGAAVGWGVQFQQPGFVVFLAVVVLLFSLNMWGLFEINLPQGLAQASGGQPREGLAGHFASGLFATLMATPCSAPFLGTAVGFALAQKAPIIFAIFLAVGLGMALPYLLLALFPGAAKLLPKPGQWMVTLRGVMGFLLAGAAIWLFYVLAGQVTPERLAFLQLTLLGLALFVWLSSQAAPATNGRRLWTTLALAAAVSGVLLASASPAPAAAASSVNKLIDWIPFDEGDAEALASAGSLVFVDVTADWCLTCKVIERGVLETQDIASAFKTKGVIAMQADWTNPDPKIIAYLNKYGRSSIPFYILYRPGQEPYIFNESLTKDRLRTALGEA